MDIRFLLANAKSCIFQPQEFFLEKHVVLGNSWFFFCIWRFHLWKLLISVLFSPQQALFALENTKPSMAVCVSSSGHLMMLETVIDAAGQKVGNVMGTRFTEQCSNPCHISGQSTFWVSRYWSLTDQFNWCIHDACVSQHPDELAPVHAPLLEVGPPLPNVLCLQLQEWWKYTTAAAWRSHDSAKENFSYAPCRYKQHNTRILLLGKAEGDCRITGIGGVCRIRAAALAAE